MFFALQMLIAKEKGQGSYQQGRKAKSKKQILKSMLVRIHATHMHTKCPKYPLTRVLYAFLKIFLKIT